MPCGAYFLDMGMILSLLPPPPARILDLGVGTGWTSIFLANRGYNVIGQDISPEGIELANQGKAKADLGNLDFIVSDYEQMKFSSEFDGAVFYDCLHHSEDPREALSSVYRALRPGGLCVTMEPGTGHAAAQVSTAATQQWGVTEKDMPPKKIIALATQIGFRKHQVYIRMTDPIKIPSPSSIRDNLNIVKRVRPLRRKPGFPPSSYPTTSSLLAIGAPRPRCLHKLAFRGSLVPAQNYAKKFQISCGFQVVAAPLSSGDGVWALPSNAHQRTGCPDEHPW